MECSKFGKTLDTMYYLLKRITTKSKHSILGEKKSKPSLFIGIVLKVQQGNSSSIYLFPLAFNTISFI